MNTRLKLAVFNDENAIHQHESYANTCLRRVLKSRAIAYALRIEDREVGVSTNTNAAFVLHRRHAPL